MKPLTQNAYATTIGITKSGKKIYRRAVQNLCFERQDHLDAYKAHATYLTFNILPRSLADFHRNEMNQHYLAAVQCDSN